MEKYVKFGLPIITAIILIVYQLKTTGVASSTNLLGGLFFMIFWGVFFVVLLIVGIIVWLNSKNTYLLQAFAFSVLTFVAVLVLFPKRSGSKYTPGQLKEQRLKKKESAVEAKRKAIERTLELEKLYKENPNDLKTAESLALIYSSKVEYDKALPFLESAIKNNSQEYKIYKLMGNHLWRKQDFANVEVFAKEVLRKDSIGELDFEKYQRNNFLDQLNGLKKLRSKNLE